MENIISVYTRSVYGRSLVYVANPEQAKHLFALTGAKTLEHRHLCALEALGFTIQQVPDPKVTFSFKAAGPSGSEWNSSRVFPIE